MNTYYYLFLLFFTIHQTNGYFFPFSSQKKPFYIFIETQGNAVNPGRIIDDSFEAEITFNAAQYLKNALQEKQQNIKITVQRSEDLSNATIANRLKVDLYLQISACKSNNTGINLFSFSYHDSFILKDGLSFISYDQIYLLNKITTDSWLEIVSDSLEHNKLLKGVYSFPYRPLIGIKAPAFALELSLKNKSELLECITIFAHSLEPIIKD